MESSFMDFKGKKSSQYLDIIMKNWSLCTLGGQCHFSEWFRQLSAGQTKGCIVSLFTPFGPNTRIHFNKTSSGD